MSYRDEKESLRARVDELEKQLADRDATIARLTHGAPTPEPGDMRRPSPLLRQAAFVLLDRDLDFEIDDAGFERIAALLRRSGANVAQVGRTLNAPGFSLQCADGRTRVRMSADNRMFPIGAAIGALASGSFVGLAGFALAHDLVDRTLAEGHFLWIAPLCVALFVPGFWRLARSAAGGSERKHRATFEAILEIAKEHAVKSGVQVRVEASSEAELAVSEEEPGATGRRAGQR